MCFVNTNVYDKLYVFVRVHGFLCICLRIIASLINLRYAPLASSHLMRLLLHPLFQIRCIDPHSVILCLVSHPMTVIINDT